MNTSYSVTGLFVSVICLLGVSGCSRSEPAGLRFGAIVPLSNDFAASGNYIKRGIDRAVRELHAQGRDIEVVYEDACVPARALPAAAKLITLDRVDALVSNFCVIALPALQQTVQQNEIITIQTSVLPEEFLERSPYLFSSFPAAELEAKALAEYALARSPKREAAILHLQTPWGEDYSRSFAHHFSALGGSITAVESKAISKNDFRAELLRIKARGPDVVFLIHFGSSLAALLKQARQLGMTQVFLGVQDAYDPEMLQAAGSDANGLVFFLPGVPEHLRVGIADEKHPLTQHAYANTIALANAFFFCELESKCVRERLRVELQGDAGSSVSLNRVRVKEGQYSFE